MKCMGISAHYHIFNQNKELKMSMQIDFSAFMEITGQMVTAIGVWIAYLSYKHSKKPPTDSNVKK